LMISPIIISSSLLWSRMTIFIDAPWGIVKLIGKINNNIRLVILTYSFRELFLGRQRISPKKERNLLLFNLNKINLWSIILESNNFCTWRSDINFNIARNITNCSRDSTCVSTRVNVVIVSKFASFQ